MGSSSRDLSIYRRVKVRLEPATVLLGTRLYREKLLQKKRQLSAELINRVVSIT